MDFEILEEGQDATADMSNEEQDITTDMSNEFLKGDKGDKRRQR